MNDERRIREAIEAEEARVAARTERDGAPRIGSPRVEEARLLSVVIGVTLGIDDATADELAWRLLQDWPYDIARRAVDLAAQSGRTGPDEVVDLGKVIVESHRLAVLRRRSAAGDREAAELVRIKRAMRLAVEEGG